MKQNKIPFFLLTGFLGSGKTSFLEHFITYHSTDKKVAVIENEFAGAGIDGKILDNVKDKPDFELVEINSGSVFCSCLFSSFQEALVKLITEKHPGVIILEATGLADPVAVSELSALQGVSDKLYLAKIFAMVDVVNFNRQKGLNCTQSQIQIADCIIINKCDLIDKLTMQTVEEEVKKLNPFAEIVHTSFGKVPPHIFECSEDTVIDKTGIKGGLVSCSTDYVTRVYRTGKAVKRENLEFFISKLDANIVRLKGTVMLENKQYALIQTVMGRTEIYDTNKQCSTELISISKSPLDFNMLHANKILVNLAQ